MVGLAVGVFISLLGQELDHPPTAPSLFHLFLSVSVAQPEKEMVPLIPLSLQVEMPGPLSFNEGKRLSAEFEIIQSLVLNSDFPSRENQGKAFGITENMSDLLDKIYFSLGSFDIFGVRDFIRLPLFSPQLNLCLSDSLEPQARRCILVLPSLQFFKKQLITDSVKQISLKIFKRGQITEAQLCSLPTEVLNSRDDYLLNNTKELTIDSSGTVYNGYFFTAEHIFSPEVQSEIKEPVRLDALRQLKYPLETVHGRLAFLPGEYWIERTIENKDGTTSSDSTVLMFHFKTFHEWPLNRPE